MHVDASRDDLLSGHLLFGSLRFDLFVVRAMVFILFFTYMILFLSYEQRPGGRVLPDLLFLLPNVLRRYKKKASFVRKNKLFVSYVNVLHNTVL